MAVVPYTTLTKLQKRASALGVSLRTDDDAAAVTAVIEDASVEVDGYCRLLYGQAALAQSDWVAKKTTDIAVHFLCLRRLNPSPKAAEALYDKAIADLERVQAGSMLLPDAPMGKANVPTLSNQRVRLDPFPRVVTEPGRSTGVQEGYRPNNDTGDFFDYSI